MDRCQVNDCPRTVSKPGHAFCLDHWKAEREGKISQCAICQKWYENREPHCPGCEPIASPDGRSASNNSDGDLLSSTSLGKHFGISNIKINLMLAELGWVERYVKGWVPTDRGNALGANVRGDAQRHAVRRLARRQY